jgi:hypothetical protein
MKRLLLTIMLLTTTTLFSQKYTLLEINSKCNANNKVKIEKIKGVEHLKVYLEDQPSSIKYKIKSVPVLILYKDERPIRQWTADITFKLSVSKKEVIKTIERLKKK